MPAKPVIGLNLNQDTRTFSLRRDYWDAVVQAGGIPLALPPVLPIDDLDTLLESLDGLVLTGGSDIDPARYGQTPHRSLVPVPQPKHDADFQLAARAIEFGIPTLGVCYGMQLLTVIHGGDLIQDIGSMVPRALDHWGSKDEGSEHPCRVEEGSLLHRILGATSLRINSHHHQAAGTTGSLRVVARAEDGVIEAVEPAKESGKWILGIQWHPERMKGRPDQLAIYRALVDAAGGYREESGYDVSIVPMR